MLENNPWGEGGAPRFEAMPAQVLGEVMAGVGLRNRGRGRNAAVLTRLWDASAGLQGIMLSQCSYISFSNPH
jgi:hypothetical protein